MPTSPSALTLLKKTKKIRCCKHRIFILQLGSRGNLGDVGVDAVAGGVFISIIPVHEAVDILQQTYPDLAIDGEMQVKFAMNKEARDEKYPFNKLKGQEVNTLVFPNLSSANATYQFIQNMTDTEIIGPIQMGLNKPIHFTDCEASVRDIVNITAVAVIDAIVEKKMEQ